MVGNLFVTLYRVIVLPIRLLYMMLLHSGLARLSVAFFLVHLNWFVFFLLFFFIHNAWVLSFNISNWDDFRFRLSWNAFDTQNLSWNPTIKLLLNSTHMWPVLVSILQNYVWQICNNCFLVRFWKKNAVFISNTFHQ